MSSNKTIGANKIFDFPSNKIIVNKILGLIETSSFFHISSLTPHKDLSSSFGSASKTASSHITLIESKILPS